MKRTVEGSRARATLAARGLMVGASLMLLSAPVWAQPQPNARQVQNYWRELRRTWRASEFNDPQSAIDAYEKFYRGLNDTNGEVAVEVVSRVAQLYGNELGQRERALQIYEEAMKQWRSPELLQRLLKEHQLMSGQASDETAPIVEAAKELAPAALPVASDARTMAGALIELLAAGQSAEQVWAGGDWKIADVVWALENVITNDGILRGRPRAGEKVREGLAELLAKHGGELVSGENWRELPLKSRLWLGDYYDRTDDERAFATLQSVLDDGKGDAEKGAVVFRATELLARRYSRKNKSKEAAQAWLEGADALPDQTWWQADALWLGGETWLVAGEQQKADEIFGQLKAGEQPFFYGASLLTRALYSYGKGDNEQTLRFAKAAVTQLENSPYPLQPAFYAQSQNMVATLEGWQREPFYSNARQLRFEFGKHTQEAEDLLTQTITIRSQRSIPLSFNSESPEVSVEVDASHAPNFGGKPVDLALFTEQKIVVTVRRPEKSKLQTKVKIASPSFPDFQLKIPIEIIYHPVKFSASALFFGFVKGEDQAQRQLTLTSPMPFRITEVTTDSPLLVTAVDSPSPATLHSVTVTIQNGTAGQVLEGKIRLKTDLPIQEVIEVPYYAHIQPTP